MSKKGNWPFYSAMIVVWLLFMLWSFASISLDKEKKEKDKKESISLWCPNFEELLTCESFLTKEPKYKDILNWTIRSDEKMCYFQWINWKSEVLEKKYILISTERNCYNKWKNKRI